MSGILLQKYLTEQVQLFQQVQNPNSGFKIADDFSRDFFQNCSVKSEVRKKESISSIGYICVLDNKKFFICPCVTGINHTPVSSATKVSEDLGKNNFKEVMRNFVESERRNQLPSQKTNPKQKYFNKIWNNNSGTSNSKQDDQNRLQNDKNEKNSTQNSKVWRISNQFQKNPTKEFTFEPLKINQTKSSQKDSDSDFDSVSGFAVEHNQQNNDQNNTINVPQIQIQKLNQKNQQPSSDDSFQKSFSSSTKKRIKNFVNSQTSKAKLYSPQKLQQIVEKNRQNEKASFVCDSANQESQNKICDQSLNSSSDENYSINSSEFSKIQLYSCVVNDNRIDINKKKNINNSNYLIRFQGKIDKIVAGDFSQDILNLPIGILQARELVFEKDEEVYSEIDFEEDEKQVDSQFSENEESINFSQFSNSKSLQDQQDLKILKPNPLNVPVYYEKNSQESEFCNNCENNNNDESEFFDEKFVNQFQNNFNQVNNVGDYLKILKVQSFSQSSFETTEKTQNSSVNSNSILSKKQSNLNLNFSQKNCNNIYKNSRDMCQISQENYSSNKNEDEVLQNNRIYYKGLQNNNDYLKNSEDLDGWKSTSEKSSVKNLVQKMVAKYEKQEFVRQN